MDVNSLAQREKALMIEPSKLYFGEAKGELEEDLEDLDEEQIIRIFKDEGMYKKDKHEIAQMSDFVGIHCHQSLYLLEQNNQLRIISYKFIKHPYWERIV